MHNTQTAAINFVITDIDFEEGFNVLTGETGAGKSIIIDALSLIFGAWNLTQHFSLESFFFFFSSLVLVMSISQLSFIPT